MISTNSPFWRSDGAKRGPLRIDYWLLISAVALVAFGLLALYSEGHDRTSGVFIPQLIRLGIGIVPFVLFWKVPVEFWQKHAAWLYVMSVGLLFLVLLAGKKVKGAQRWLQFGPIDFQPSELCKLLLVLAIAAFFVANQDQVHKLKTFLLSLLMLIPVALLVFLQPHLGATLVLVVAWLGVAIAAGVSWKTLFGAMAAILMLSIVAWNTPGVINDYQRERVHSMFVQDDEDSGFQQLRATIAIGAGGVSGEGFLKGEQKAGKYIPDQHTDFVFTILAEELGLIGSTLLLAAIGFFFYRAWLVMYQCEDPYSRIVAAGIFSILAFHMVANLGMNLSLLPVVGLWLPFVSYGGSALWLCMACVGLLLNISSGTRKMFG